MRTGNRDELARRLFALAGAALLFTSLVGCGSKNAIKTASTPFTEVPARLTVIGDEWAVTFETPTGGWQGRFDTDRRMFNGREAFITLTSPDPDAFHTQAITDVTVLTPIPVESNIDVFARVVPFTIEDGKPRGWFGSGEKHQNPPYHLAVSNQQPETLPDDDTDSE